MKNSVKQELASHILACIQDGRLTDDNIQDWHYIAFNEDYYIIGYYEAEQWLKMHGISAFDAINECIDYERSNFGEVTGKYDNAAESVVNMLAYIYGEELLNEQNFDSVNDLEEFCNDILD